MIKATVLLLLTVLPFPNTLNEHLLEKNTHKSEIVYR